MKKLNRKGFTLIELLAVIVILAIVLVVTIPSVIRSMDKARESQLQNAADSVAEWFQKQYELQDLSAVSGGAEKAYTDFVNTLTGKTLPAYSASIADNLDEPVLKAAGIGGGLTDVTGSVSLNGRNVCVILKATDTGDFKGAPNARSSNCPAAS